MNRIATCLVLCNMLISMTNVFAFANNAMLKPRIRNIRYSTCSIKMQLEDRRNLLLKPVEILKLSSMTSLASVLQPLMTKAQDYDDTWTKHNGIFSEDEIKDFQKSPTGLLYKDILVGKGKEPNDGDAVSIHMVGYIYETGEKWTNTYKGIPTFQATVRAGVRENQKFMKGLNEGVKTMKRGGRRILVIPAYLAYNYTTILAENNPNAPIIPGGSSLVCYVEVLDFHELKK